MTWDQVTTQPWMLWRRQVTAILRLELKKSLFSKRAWWIYILTLGPVLITGLHSLLAGSVERAHTMAEDNMIFAGIFQIYFLRLGIFFGCLGIFSNLFRAEVLERTLHYYFMSPVRREVLAVSKYIAGLVASSVYFGGSVVLSFLFISAHWGPVFQQYLFHGPGMAELGRYALTTVLACVGYGSVFLLSGIIIRNPLIPAAVVFVWENLNPFLPSLLKKFSVIFYLKSLLPTGELPADGPLAFLATTADPTPAWLAIPGLLVVSLLLLGYASLKARGLEVSYSE
ncbi:MAG: ABC transporter permease [Bryobacteraceae bacterium]|jgi:ABC-type transport system involved in multi-copper enzyme maturation permease subunit